MRPRLQVERLPGPPICYQPVVLGPWGKAPPGSCYVVLWLWFYITFWPRGYLMTS